MQFSTLIMLANGYNSCSYDSAVTRVQDNYNMRNRTACNVFAAQINAEQKQSPKQSTVSGPSPPLQHQQHFNTRSTHQQHHQRAQMNTRQSHIIDAVNKAWHLPYSANAAICANKGPPRGTFTHLCRRQLRCRECLREAAATTAGAQEKEITRQGR